MPFCPKCKYEYTAGIAVCSDCNEPLVDRLATPASTAAVSPDDSWVGVCTVSGSIKTGLAKGALDSNNIPSIVMSPKFHTQHGIGALVSGISPASARGDILMVPREFGDEALLILEAVLGDDFDRLDASQL
ncbi:MAG: hypothetical protein GY867_04310 [bacterium]|nr:hypothetical protein [bacterium]